MRNDLVHELIGYDPNTNRIVYREKIPGPCAAKVISMVGPDEADPDAIDSYIVDLHVANEIFSLAKLPIGPQNAEYFLESLALA
jgi:hypothetical protein